MLISLLSARGVVAFPQGPELILLFLTKGQKSIMPCLNVTSILAVYKKYHNSTSCLSRDVVYSYEQSDSKQRALAQTGRNIPAEIDKLETCVNQL